MIPLVQMQVSKLNCATVKRYTVSTTLTDMTQYPVGDLVDIRALEKITPEPVTVYFEPALVRDSTYREELAFCEGITPHMCPFIEILASVPLMVEICGIEEHEGRTVIKGLLPFLDEMDFKEEEK